MNEDWRAFELAGFKSVKKKTVVNLTKEAKDRGVQILKKLCASLVRK